MVSSPENVVPERRVKLRIIKELARVGGGYQTQITESIAPPGMASKKWMYRYFRELEEEGMIESQLEGRRKYYKLTQKGFNTLFDFHPKETIMGLVKETLESVKSKVKENTFVGTIHFDFLIENELGIRIVEGFKIPKEEIPRYLSNNSDYVKRFLSPVRYSKFEGKFILSELKTTLRKLNNVLLIYTGYEPLEVEKKYDEVRNKIYEKEPLPDEYKYEGVMEDTIKMIKKSPKNVRFVFAGTDLEKVKEVIKELLPT